MAGARWGPLSTASRSTWRTYKRRPARMPRDCGRVRPHHHHADRHDCGRRSQGSEESVRAWIDEHLTDEHAYEFAITLNCQRRQMTKEQKKRIAVELRGKGHTNAKAGSMIGVSKDTVRRWIGNDAQDVAQMRNVQPTTRTSTTDSGDTGPKAPSAQPPAVAATPATSSPGSSLSAPVDSVPNSSQSPSYSTPRSGLSTPWTIISAQKTPGTPTPTSTGARPKSSSATPGHHEARKGRRVSNSTDGVDGVLSDDLRRSS